MPFTFYTFYIFISFFCLLAFPYFHWKQGYNTYLSDLFAMLVIAFVPVANLVMLLGILYNEISKNKILIIKGKD